MATDFQKHWSKIKLTSQEPETATVDRGYAGIKQYGQTEVIKPERLKKGSSWRAIKKYKERLRKQVAIEPTIGPIKQDHRVEFHLLKVIKREVMKIIHAAITNRIYFSHVRMNLLLYFQPSITTIRLKNGFLRADNTTHANPPSYTTRKAPWVKRAVQPLKVLTHLKLIQLNRPTTAG